MEGLVDKKDSLDTFLPTAEMPRSRIHSASPRRNKISIIVRAVLLCLCLAGLLVSSDSLLRLHTRAGGGSVDSLWSALEEVVSNHAGPSHTEALCPQVEQLLPERNKVLWDAVGDQFGTDAFKEKAVDWLGGAVRVPTESYDDMDPVGVDPRWTKFQAFHDYLLEAFPLVHSSLKVTKVNTYGLIYEWPGSDSSLKPLLLTAHQDVVPVDPRTVDEWAHPPFSGFFDGARIWGRGSSDDKSGLIGVMSTTETLLGAKFQPTRKIVLAFGFDEEVSGLYGAYELGKHLEATYGKDAFAMVVDEGGGFSEQYGGVFAVPAVGEKGYFDTLLEVLSPGGHSSVPPVHTSIGILSALLVEYETHPIPAFLDRTTPFYGMLQCFAAHAPDMDSKLRKTVQQSASSDKALHELEKVIAKDKALRALVGTTQAIDLIQGGVKANALPEQAWAIVNHRIASQSSVAATKEHDTKLLVELAEKLNLTYNAFGKDLHTGSSGSLTLTDAFHSALEPAPITPTDAAPYKLLSGTIRATYNSHRSFRNTEELQVVPGILTGNTDTQYYWNLTKHIFRYNHENMLRSDGIPGGIHTVNESIAVESFLEMIRFFATLILNVDEYEI